MPPIQGQLVGMGPLTGELERHPLAHMSNEFLLTASGLSVVLVDSARVNDPETGAHII